MTQRDEGTLDNNLSLIVEIQKYEYLYNFNMPEYSKKDMTEKAWGEISKKIGVSINDCKEKWRNIRSAFLRSLKTTGGKSKRPYYLTEELKFVMPYIKPHHQSVVGTLYSSSADSAESRNIIELDVNDVIADESHFGLQDVPIFVAAGTTVVPPAKSHSSPTAETAAETPTAPTVIEVETSRRKKRKRVKKTDLENCFRDYLTYKKQKDETKKTTTESSLPQPTYSHIQHFFMSLMPDIDSMTEEQVRRFKIEVLMLIDKLKST
ncbi:uncharacterized protein LOC135080792 [Ostrinia nubilalis]|uniref:uncharacterized protein LOC135080792 n=1 Tax=Ostrinia nubilalis TaxID=29057 RepID=UPI0030822B2A